MGHASMTRCFRSVIPGKSFVREAVRVDGQGHFLVDVL